MTYQDIMWILPDKLIECNFCTDYEIYNLHSVSNTFSERDTLLRKYYMHNICINEDYEIYVYLIDILKQISHD